MAEYEKKRNERKAELLVQMEEQKHAQSIAKQKELDLERNVLEISRRVQEKLDAASREKLRSAIESGRAEFDRFQELSEKRKRDTSAEKERERAELEKSEKQHKDLVAQYSLGRNNERANIARDLQTQIDLRRNESAQQRAAELEEERKREDAIRERMLRSGMCPHGKRYICAHCHRTYPRAQLSKRPLKRI